MKQKDLNPPHSPFAEEEAEGNFPERFRVVNF
jgi:hypothetical protein